jgi:hypothetical protein
LQASEPVTPHDHAVCAELAAQRSVQTTLCRFLTNANVMSCPQLSTVIIDDGLALLVHYADDEQGSSNGVHQYVSLALQ